MQSRHITVWRFSTQRAVDYPKKAFVDFYMRTKFFHPLPFLAHASHFPRGSVCVCVCLFESVFTYEIPSMYPPPCLTCCRDSSALLTPSSMLVCASPAHTDKLNHLYMETGIVNKNKSFLKRKDIKKDDRG